MNVLAWRFDSQNAEEALHRRDEFATALDTVRGHRYDAFAAALIYGELVTNVVKHAPGPVSIELAFDGDDAVLTVRDWGSGFVPHVALPADIYSESGRGLCIVEVLSKRLTVELSTAGTCIRAVLPYQNSAILD